MDFGREVLVAYLHIGKRELVAKSEVLIMVHVLGV